MDSPKKCLFVRQSNFDGHRKLYAISSESEEGKIALEQSKTAQKYQINHQKISRPPKPLQKTDRLPTIQAFPTFILGKVLPPLSLPLLLPLPIRGRIHLPYLRDLLRTPHHLHRTNQRVVARGPTGPEKGGLPRKEAISN